MNIFDILGPIMVGPSSSHTAGAVRIGYLAKVILKDVPTKAQITLHGSFATTGIGHGTDKALVAGLLSMKPDDIRIPDSFQIAKERQLAISFSQETIPDAHPNTAVIKLEGEQGRRLTMQASSIGGGRIMINKLDGIDVNFTSEKPTLIIQNIDKPGLVAEVTSLLFQEKCNIATMQLLRDKRGGRAVMVIELDDAVSKPSVARLEQLPDIIKVIYIDSEVL